jgi:hypothetical protein
MVAQPSAGGNSLNSQASITHPDTELSIDQGCEGAPESLAVVAKTRGVEVGSEEWSDEAALNKPAAPRPQWRRALVPGFIVLLTTTLIFLLLIVGSHLKWWTL